MAIVGLAGAAVWLCGSEAPVPTPWRDSLDRRATAGFPRHIGAAVVPAPPRRIVAASVASAETLLGLVGRDRIAGVHVLATDARYSGSAAAAATLPVVGAEPEQLVAVRPDLVFVDEFSRAEVPQLLRAVGIPVVRTLPVRTFADIADNVRLIGCATGDDAGAERAVVAMEQQLLALASAAGAVAAWRVMCLNGDLDTYGAHSLFDAAVQRAGARHLPAEHGVGGYQKLDIETVLAWRPDALVVGGDEPAAIQWLQDHPGLRLLPCVQRGRVLRLPTALLGATSPHAVALAETLQRQLLTWGRP